ncbi:hypothetical protein HYH03_001273 [Edaphochlamys debaryana]|uniref:PKD domain-containing protein n=1 Tax=Edaphochlamys debaryana TaxID=47281 RepID=A0A835YMP3_9CHLO|nr:hypothetical protein HYH03_001273 [Edaphochlamys debaryana]|eukprot:KAG2500494.1 hypothetical protein HYH03_001273 [Edaphochlamys debaryana]
MFSSAFQDIDPGVLPPELGIAAGDVTGIIDVVVVASPTYYDASTFCAKRFPVDIQLKRYTAPVTLVTDTRCSDFFTVNCEWESYAKLDPCPAVYVATSTVKNPDGSVALTQTQSFYSPGKVGAAAPSFVPGTPGGSPSVTPSAPKTDETVTLTFQTIRNCATTVLGDCKVQWGDGAVQSVPCPDSAPTRVPHVYGTAGRYTITVEVFVKDAILPDPPADTRSISVTVVPPNVAPDSLTLTWTQSVDADGASRTRWTARAKDANGNLKTLTLTLDGSVTYSYDCPTAAGADCSATWEHRKACSGPILNRLTATDALGASTSFGIDPSTVVATTRGVFTAAPAFTTASVVQGSEASLVLVGSHPCPAQGIRCQVDWADGTNPEVVSCSSAAGAKHLYNTFPRPIAAVVVVQEAVTSPAGTSFVTSSQALANIQVTNKAPSASVVASAAAASPAYLGSIISVLATASDVTAELSFLTATLATPFGGSSTLYSAAISPPRQTFTYSTTPVFVDGSVSIGTGQQPQALLRFVVRDHVCKETGFTLTCRVSWGDSATVVDTVPCDQSAGLAHTYAAVGRYTARVVAEAFLRVDGRTSGQALSLTATVDVTNAAPTASVTASQGPLTAAGAAITVTPTAADVDSNLAKLEFTLTASNGFFYRGTPSCTGASCAPAAVTLQVTCPGVYTADAIATDSLSLTGSARTTIPIDTPPASFSGNPSFGAGPFLKNSPVSLTFTPAHVCSIIAQQATLKCTIFWGDNSPDDAFPCGSGVGQQRSHTYQSSGPFTATVTVSVPNSPTNTEGQASASLVVSSGTPVLDPSSFRITPLLLPVGGSVSAAATATDPGADLKELVIDWGDGTNTSFPCTASPKSTCSLPATASHVYSVTGVFAPTATPADDDGTPASPVPLPAGFVVVYDPQGGFVVGGGWITSPPGALASDTAQTLTGVASFGFNSKYKAGASAPTGNTEFVFSAGGFRFRSTSYDWMVISGSRVQFKGSGIVNSQPSPVYKFSIMAEDGGSTPGSDRFRLRVFSLAADGTTEIKVYDNFVGGAATDCASLSDPSCDFRAATTALGGGSIVIQKSPSGRRSAV